MKQKLSLNPFKILWIFCVIINCQLSIINCTAQAYTVYECNFDHWTDGKPDGWGTTPASVTVSQYTPAYSGSYACKVERTNGGAVFTGTETFPMYWGKKYVLSFTAKLPKGYTGTDSRLFPIVLIKNLEDKYLEQFIEIPVDDVWRNYEIEFLSTNSKTKNSPERSLGNHISINIQKLTGDGVEFIIDNIKLVAKDRTMEFDYLDINNVSAYINPLTPFLHDGNRAFEVPKNSGKSTIFTSNIWLGGLDSESNLHVAAHRFCQHGYDFWLGPATTDFEVIEGKKVYSDTYIQKYYHTWKVTKAEINYHRAHYADANYEMPWGIAHWPAHGRTEFGESPMLAPYKNVAGSNSYEPALGDYPDIRGDQTVFFIINDAMDAHTETDGARFNFDVLGTAYAYNSSDLILQNTIFLSYELLNNSIQEYNNFYFGFWTDFDLGYARDDYVGCDTSLNLGFVYNGTDIDGNGEPHAYGENPPAQGAMLLNQKMSAFVYHNNDNSVTGDPRYAIDYYNYLQAKWRNGVQMTEGGNGLNSGSTDYTNFMFSGDPLSLTGWTELTPNGPGSTPNSPADRRALMSTGPFTFPAGERLRIDVALPFVRDFGNRSALSSLALLKEVSMEIQEYYDENIVGIREHNNIATGKLFVYPNPSNGKFTLSSEKAIEQIEIFDMLGKKVFSDTPKAQTAQLNTHLPQGLYIYRAVLVDQSVCAGKVLINN